MQSLRNYFHYFYQKLLFSVGYAPFSALRLFMNIHLSPDLTDFLFTKGNEFFFENLLYFVL